MTLTQVIDMKKIVLLFCLLIMSLPTVFGQLPCECSLYRPNEWNGPIAADELTNTDKGAFRIHYTIDKKSKHAITYTYLSLVTQYLTESLATYQAKGYKMPPSDKGAGGNENYDVYIVNLNHCEGLTCTDGAMDKQGKNQNIAASYMVINNTIPYNDPIYPSVSNPLKATVTHEFFHMIQEAYYGSSLRHLQMRSSFLREGTAVWAESLFSPQVNQPENKHYYNNIGLFMKPNNGLFSDAHSYSMVFFWKYVSEQYGEDIIRKLWEESGKWLCKCAEKENCNCESEDSNNCEGEDCVPIDELTALENVFKDYGVHFRDVVENFFITNLLLTGNEENFNFLVENFTEYTYKESGLDYSTELLNESPVLYTFKGENALQADKVFACDCNNAFNNACQLQRVGANYHAIDMGGSNCLEVKVIPTNTACVDFSDPVPDENSEPYHFSAMLVKKAICNDGSLLDLAIERHQIKDGIISFEAKKDNFTDLSLIVYRYIPTPLKDGGKHPVISYNIDIVDKYCPKEFTFFSCYRPDIEERTVSIYNLYGREIATNTLTADANSQDDNFAQGLPVGFYVMTIRDKNGVVLETKKIASNNMCRY